MMRRHVVTARQAEVLAVLEALYRRRGLPPTTRELAGSLRISEPAARMHLRALQHAGRVRQVRGHYLPAWAGEIGEADQRPTVRHPAEQTPGDSRRDRREPYSTTGRKPGDRLSRVPHQEFDRSGPSGGDPGGTPA